MSWTLLKDIAKVKSEAAANLDALITKMTFKRTGALA